MPSLLEPYGVPRDKEQLDVAQLEPAIDIIAIRLLIAERTYSLHSSFSNSSGMANLAFEIPDAYQYH